MHVGIACLNGILYIKYVCAELSNVCNVSMHAWHVCMYPSEAGGGGISFIRTFFLFWRRVHTLNPYLPTYLPTVYTLLIIGTIYIYTSYIKKPYIYY